MPPTSEDAGTKAGEDNEARDQASSLNIGLSNQDFQRLKFARSSFQRLDQDSKFKDRFKDIVAKARARQKDGNSKLFVVGQENTFDPGDPATWPLYSPDYVPEITPEAWYDPLGVFGFPAFVILDDRCACVIAEKGFPKDLLYGTWCGNYNRDGDIWTKAAHLGHPAVNSDGKIFHMRFGQNDFVFIGNQRVDRDTRFEPIDRVFFKGIPTNNVKTFKRSINSANEQPTEQQFQSPPNNIKQTHSSSELSQDETPERRPAASSTMAMELSSFESSMYLLLSTTKRLAEENLALFHIALKATDIIKEVSQISFDKSTSLSSQERLDKIEVLLLDNPTSNPLQAEPVFNNLQVDLLRSRLFGYDLRSTLDRLPIISKTILDMSKERFTDLKSLSLSLEGCSDLEKKKKLSSISYEQRDEQLNAIYKENQGDVDPMLTCKLVYKYEAPVALKRKRMEAEEYEDEEMKEGEENEEWTGCD